MKLCTLYKSSFTACFQKFAGYTSTGHVEYNPIRQVELACFERVDFEKWSEKFASGSPHANSINQPDPWQQ